MCLAIPGKVIQIEGHKGKVDFSGAGREVDFSLIPEVRVGDYVLVHAGCAIQIMPADEARETLQLFAEMMDGATDE